jgi:hypothetical protein
VTTESAWLPSDSTAPVEQVHVDEFQVAEVLDVVGGDRRADVVQRKSSMSPVRAYVPMGGLDVLSPRSGLSR